MPSQLVLSVRQRATPLNRGWRSADPSPSRTSNGLPHFGVSSCEVTDDSDISDEDARDSSPDQFERAADTACADAAPDKQSDPASGLQLKLHVDDHQLMEVSTPRGHDQEACRGTSSAAGAPPPVARVGAGLDAAWARIRTPSPDARAYAPRAPPAWPQGTPGERPPQWTPLWQHALSPVARAGAAPDEAWARTRAPAPSEVRALAPPAWSQGTPQRPPQWTRVPFEEPSAEPPPPPPAPVAAAAPRGQACAKEPRTTMAKNDKKKCQPLDCMGMPKDFKGVLSVGSVGHPYTCQDPCKFVRKNRGCKDGADCSRCHVCLWNSYEARRATKMKQ